MDGMDGHRSYWHDLRTEERIVSKRQGGGVVVMIWKAFSSNGCGTIEFLGGRQDFKDYSYFLENHLLSFTNEYGPAGFIFQQDNASNHISHIAMDSFDAHNIYFMTCSARSPDLSPNENLWEIFSRRGYTNGRQFTSISDPEVAIQTDWNRIDQNVRHTFTRSITERCTAVFEVKRKAKKYLSIKL